MKIYIAPPKVTDVTGKQVTINWGDGFIARGDKLDVFALKIKENADPIVLTRWVPLKLTG